MFDRAGNRILASGQRFEILSSLMFPVYKLSQENTQRENIFDIAFGQRVLSRQ